METVDRLPLCMQGHTIPKLKLPPPLTMAQKFRAFMGNDKLLALHARRQASKKHYDRFY
jgi:hypothetical protein